MASAYPQRSRPQKIFWTLLDLSMRALARVWPIAPQYEAVVERVRVPLPALPPAFDGLTIAHLSDFHSGQHVHRETLRRVVERTNALHPDLIVLTGDYVHRSVAYAAECAEALSHLHAPLGVQLVLGNHDYWKNHEVVERALRRVGLVPLKNEAHRIARGDEAIYIVGVDDARMRRADLTKALRGVPCDAFKLMLVHEPDFADFAQGHGIALQLSGHSHGGQVCLPLRGPLLLPTWGRKYPWGLNRTRDGMWVYTTRGIGVAMPPIRVNCPPEITLLTLARSEKGL